MSKRKVTYARMHGTSHVPGVGNLDAVLPPQSKSFKEFDMYLTDNDALDVRVTTQGGVKIKFIVAAANIQLAVYVETEEAQTKSPADAKKAG